MKRKAKRLLEKACDALVLSVELFNRPHDRGRVTSCLILLDHAFEMLLKAAIVHRGGSIRDKGAKETIGFDACVRRGLSNGEIKFLDEDQALSLQAINGLRDAAQHYLSDISEGLLYMHMQTGVTLFGDILKSVFDHDLADKLPARVLPISTVPPMGLEALFDTEIAEVRKLLGPGRRRGVDARSRLRPLAVLDATLRGETGQPSDRELNSMAKQISQGTPWTSIFPGVAAVDLTAEGVGPSMSLRISKKEGVPITLVPEGTPGASVVALKRVNELGYYCLGAKRLAEKLGISMPKLIAVVDTYGVRENTDYYKEFKIGKTRHKQYSQRAIDAIKDILENRDIDDIWNEYNAARAKAKSRA